MLELLPEQLTSWWVSGRQSSACIVADVAEIAAAGEVVAATCPLCDSRMGAGGCSAAAALCCYARYQAGCQLCVQSWSVPMP